MPSWRFNATAATAAEHKMLNTTSSSEAAEIYIVCKFLQLKKYYETDTMAHEDIVLGRNTILKQRVVAIKSKLLSP